MKYTLFNGDLCNKRDSSISNKNGTTSSIHSKCSTIRLVPSMGIMVTAIMTTMALQFSGYKGCHVYDACGISISINKDSNEIATIDTGISMHITTIDMPIIDINSADLFSKDSAAMTAKDSAAMTLKGNATIDQHGFYPLLDPNNMNKTPLPQASNPAHAKPATLSVQEDDAVRAATTGMSSRTYLQFDWLNWLFLQVLVLVVFVASHACSAVSIETKTCMSIYASFLSKFNSTHMVYPKDQPVPRSKKMLKPPTWTMHCLLVGILLSVASGSPCNDTSGGVVNPSRCSCGFGIGTVLKLKHCSGKEVKDSSNSVIRFNTLRDAINGCANNAKCKSIYSSGQCKGVEESEDFIQIRGFSLCSTDDDTAYSRSGSSCVVELGPRYCDTTTGLFCELANNKCGKLSKCDTIDGTVVNPTNCSCGTADCDSASGLFCESTNNKCGKTSKCDTIDGTVVNPTNCSCGTNDCSSFNGLFCYGSENRCAAGPPCSNTNGLTSNGGECTCGTSDCDTTTGLFCYGSQHRCATGPPCSNTNGSTANGGACTCGTNDCSSFNGLFCESANNKCGKLSTCNSIDGTLVNQQNCSCGSTTCDTTTGLFCTNKGASNYCAKTKYCDQTEGMFVNSYDCNCDASGSTECDIFTGRYCTISKKSCSKLPTSYTGVAEISVLGSTVVSAAMGAYKYAGIRQDNEPVYTLKSDTNTFFMYWTESSGNWTIATTLGGNITRPYVYWHGNIPSHLSPKIQALSLGFMDYKGSSGCTSTKPCTECQGDCDNDGECFGALKCLQRSSGDGISVNCGLDIPAQDNRDYCYDDTYSSGSKMEEIMVVSSLIPYCTTILDPETFCAGMNSKKLIADAYKRECEGLTCEISKDAPKCCDLKKEDALPTQCLLQSPNSCHGTLKTLILMQGSDNPFDGVDKNKAIHR